MIRPNLPFKNEYLSAWEYVSFETIPIAKVASRHSTAACRAQHPVDKAPRAYQD